MKKTSDKLPQIMNCETEACVVTLKYIVPTLGGITAIGIFMAPWNAVKELNSKQRLGDLNPLPFPMMVSNTLGVNPPNKVDRLQFPHQRLVCIHVLDR
jgi:hypothetical protein